MLHTTIQLIFLIFIVSISVLKPWGQRKVKKQLNRKVVIITGVLIGVALSTSIISQNTQLNYYRNLQIKEINLNRIDDGRYVGKVDYAFEYEVEVIIENHTIKDIIFLRNRDSHYTRLAEGIKYKIIREQKINIDAVTGSTTTSKVFLKAIEKALNLN